jgi:hypothetical protein
MAGGKRIKFQDTRIQFLTGWSGDSPSSAIAGITRANPAVVNEVAHGRSDGTLIRIMGALGMTEVNDVPFLIDVADSTHYSLIDVDSTDYGTYTSGGKADQAQFSTLCELTGFNQQGGTKPEIPATSQCSVKQEFEFGLGDDGSVQIDFNYAPQVAVQQAITDAYDNGTLFAYKLTFVPEALSAMFEVGVGYVTQVSKQGAVGGMWTGSFTLRLTGKTYLFGV